MSDISQEEIDEELGDGGSINGFDRFFDSIFQDDLETMRERFAEIRTLVREGDIDGAKEILEHYRNVADELESDVSPDQRDEAVRLSQIIRSAVEDIEDRISEADRDEFDFISETAENVGTAAELASKIKELCVELSAIDPVAYDRTCGADEDSAPWQRALHDDLTDEQRDEAREFGEILSSCMRTSGEDCRCEDISFVAMQEMCITARPLAIACDIEDDEDSCDKLDSLEFPEMPDYLQNVADRLDDQYDEDNYDNHFPGACSDAGIRPTDSNAREACFAVMIEIEAPPECRDAIRAAGVTNERGAREICEEIMGELGFDDRNDRGHGGQDCGGIPDPDARLDCYDNLNNRNFEDEFREDYRRDFEQGFDEFNQERRDFRGRFENECPFEERQACMDQGKRWDCSKGSVKCFEGDFDDREFRDIGRDRYRDRPIFDCATVSCFDGEYCDPYKGCVSDDHEEDTVSCYNFRSRSSCEPHCYWDTVNDECFPFDYDSGDESDTGCPREDTCPVYSRCVNGVYECYGEEQQFNEPSNPDYDPTRGGDGTSCAEGYENSNGNCVPFGEGDYDFEDDNSGSSDGDHVEEDNGGSDSDSSEDSSGSSDSSGSDDSGSDSDNSDSGSDDSS